MRALEHVVPIRLAAWAAFILGVGALNFVDRFLGGRPPRDAFFRYEFAVGGLIQYAVILGVTLLIARGLSKRPVFALYRPTSWALAAGLSVGIVVGIAALSPLIQLLGDPGREQGLVPRDWDGDRALAFACSLAVVALAAPVVEELLFRGLGFSLLERFGRSAAILAGGVAFGLWHGLLLALPLLVAFGIGLAYMRSRTRSVYPGIVLHSAFNALQVVLSVTLSG